MAPTKSRKTYTLDPELVRYLEVVREERKVDSSSAALEQILRESQKKRESQKLESSITAYYDSQTDADRQEDRAWAKFAESQIPED